MAMAIWVRRVCCVHERSVIVRVRHLWLCELGVGEIGVRRWGGVVRGTVRPTRCGSLRLGVVGALGIVRSLCCCLEDVSVMLTIRAQFCAYLRVVVVLRHRWLIRLVDGCWRMISLISRVRRSVRVGFRPIIRVLPFESWGWTLCVEGRRILIAIRVVRRRHLANRLVMVRIWQQRLLRWRLGMTRK